MGFGGGGGGSTGVSAHTHTSAVGNGGDLAVDETQIGFGGVSGGLMYSRIVTGA